MTVGQLVATMQANNLNPTEAAEDMNLPLAQVQEALVYYDLHCDLIDIEMAEETRQFRK